MKTLLPLIRENRAAFRYGKTVGRRLHVSSRPMAVVAHCFGLLKPGTARGQQGDKTPAIVAQRRALYLGAMSGVREGKRLCQAFNL